MIGYGEGGGGRRRGVGVRVNNVGEEYSYNTVNCNCVKIQTYM